MKILGIMGLIVLASSMAPGQPSTGPVFWSPTQPDCSSLNETPVAITNSSGATVGYSCYVAGSFAWLAAGGGWATSIRVAAPSSGAVGIDYFFYDTKGNDLAFDAAFGRSSPVSRATSESFALYSNQPAEVNLLGAAGDGPAYNTNLSGSAYAVFYCPDANTCSAVRPQLIYSALPAIPWSLTVPITWDTNVWTQWSAAGIDDGGDNMVALAIYNEDTTATAYTVRVYDSNGTLAGTGTTPSIPPMQSLGNGYYGQGGTYGELLKNIIPTALPSGIFKVLVDGGTKYSAVVILQFSGGSGTSLQTAYDYAPTAGAVATSAAPPPPVLSALRARVMALPKPAFRQVGR